MKTVARANRLRNKTRQLGVTVFAFTFIVAAGILSLPNVLKAQGPLPTPDAVGALQATVQAQQNQIDALEKSAQNANTAIELNKRAMNADVNDQLWWVRLAGIALALIGVSSVVVFYQKYKSVEKSLLEKMEASLNQRADAIQANLNRKLDETEKLLEVEADRRIQKAQEQFSERLRYINPADVRLHVPHQNFQAELETLQVLGFRNIQTYVKLDGTCLNDCVIVHFTQDPKDDMSETDALMAFLDEYKPEPGKVGYLIYIKQGRVPDRVMEKFPVITYANSIVTVDMNALTLARVLYH